MTKKDITRGDLVLLRDGRICVVWKDADDPNLGLTLYGKTKSTISIISPCPKIVFGKIAHLYDYNDDLTISDDYKDYDVMAIRKTSDNFIRFSVPLIFDALFDSENFDSLCWDWERKEIKEVTMSEVEEKFGCKVKIVKEEDDE